MREVTELVAAMTALDDNVTLVDLITFCEVRDVSELDDTIPLLDRIELEVNWLSRDVFCVAEGVTPRK